MEDFDKNMHFNFDLVDTVIVRESNYNLHVGHVVYVEYGTHPIITSRRVGDKLYLDFAMPIAKGGVVVDNAISNSSTNPVQNHVVKAYIDENKSVFKKLLYNAEGVSSYTSAGCFADYDLLVCRGNTDGIGVPMDFTVLLRLKEETDGQTTVQLDDGRFYNEFVFTDNGFYTSNYTGESSGRIFAVYGIKF